VSAPPIFFLCGPYRIKEAYVITLLSVVSVSTLTFRFLCDPYRIKEAYVITLLSVCLCIPSYFPFSLRSVSYQGSLWDYHGFCMSVWFFCFLRRPSRIKGKHAISASHNFFLFLHLGLSFYSPFLSSLSLPSPNAWEYCKLSLVLGMLTLPVHHSMSATAWEGMDITVACACKVIGTPCRPWSSWREMLEHYQVLYIFRNFPLWEDFTCCTWQHTKQHLYHVATPSHNSWNCNLNFLVHSRHTDVEEYSKFSLTVTCIMNAITSKQWWNIGV
jgi:hypothetical protein